MSGAIWSSQASALARCSAACRASLRRRGLAITSGAPAADGQVDAIFEAPPGLRPPDLVEKSFELSVHIGRAPGFPVGKHPAPRPGPALTSVDCPLSRLHCNLGPAPRPLAAPATDRYGSGIRAASERRPARYAAPMT